MAMDPGSMGVEAYIYVYPLVTMEITRRQLTIARPGERPGHGPVGVFSHVRAFPPADFKEVVRPNFDTLYSIAWLDLRSEPSVISVPDTDGRYYVLPLYDMWTDAFAAPGKRTSGTGPQSYAILGPGWHGELPDGLEPIRAGTPTVWIIGRTQTNGPSDYAAVHSIQDAMTITPLSEWGTTPTPVDPVIDPAIDMDTPPLEQVHAMTGRDYFSLAADLMKVHPPHATDWSILARLRTIGLVPGEDFEYGALDPATRELIDASPALAQRAMADALPRLARVVNGWEMITDTMGVYGNFYLKRAVVAMIGLGANQAEDAIYPLNVADRDGDPLDGSANYILHFGKDELPPVSAFWSVTMYDAHGYQAANPLNRFAIGDRDPLQYNADGSLDIYLQHDSPGAAHESNWLPAPEGPLGVTLRLYAPNPEALDGRWSPPPIIKA